MDSGAGGVVALTFSASPGRKHGLLLPQHPLLLARQPRMPSQDRLLWQGCREGEGVEILASAFGSES